MTSPFLRAAAIALAAGISIAPASAGTLADLKDAAAEASLVHKTWGCHRSCEDGPGGWHRHVGPYCARVACVPQAPHPYRCWVGRFGYRHCAW